MLVEQKHLIQRALENGTGASISIAATGRGLQSSLKIWFSDLVERSGPVAELSRYGLLADRVDLTLGHYSGPTIAQIKRADPEQWLLARALVASISCGVEIRGQCLSDWQVVDGQFRMTSVKRHLDERDRDTAVLQTCNEILVPMMAAMAELIGYDELDDDDDEVNSAGRLEGALRQRSEITRERNPRNRVLCLRIHGHTCFICGLEPSARYQDAGSIIEVHHLLPLALLHEPKSYDPREHLIPLCPNCHRAVHTRRPVPWTPAEISARLGHSSNG